MNKRTYRITRIAMSLASMAVLLVIAFTWGAPVLMPPFYPKAEMAKLCAQTKGCRAIDVETQWNSSKSRYQPIVEVFYKSMSTQDMNNLATEVRRAFETAAGRNPVFGFRFRNVSVLFYHAK